MNIEEKILILSGLFHDIGKFRQRCVENFETHQIESVHFIKDYKDLFRFVLNNREEYLNKLIFLVENHHNKEIKDELLIALQEADYLSASERVEAELDEDKKIVWGYDYLASLNSKIKLNTDKKTSLRFYKHSYLTRKNYEVLIPEEKNKVGDFKYKESDWFNFIDDFKTVMSFYEKEEDFNTLINLLLVLFEKYMWCIPDFTGSEETDISLFNHLKDVAGLALAIFRNKKVDINNSDLILVVGDIPGIQNYITDVNNTRAAKVLRGRSINIQILSRMFASVFLDTFDLSENNLIMLAGGKFYIILPNISNFIDIYKNAKLKIERYLIDVFHYDLKFISAYEKFNYSMLKEKKLNFGGIIEKAEQGLLREKNSVLKEHLFNDNIQQNFIIPRNFVKDDESDKVKCAVTEKPMFEGETSKIEAKDENEEDIIVSSQVKREYIIGDKIVDENLVIQFKDDNLTIDETNIYSLEDIMEKEVNYSRKIILNPDIDKMLDINKGNQEIFKRLKNCSFIDVANYCTKYKERVMSFEEMSGKNIGAEYLTMIKGDVDNLGLIMALGLQDDKNNLTAISRTTTFSNHYKYFFSFFINGFLKDKFNGQNDACIYTIFAGGDDILFVCPQSVALQLIENFDKVFKDFICENKEIHISYSITHFKHSTPIRLVAEFAEKNQDKAKKDYIQYSEIEKIITNTPDIFFEENNKASLFLFETVIKISEINELIKTSYNLTNWGTKTDDKKEEISSGVLRNLLIVAELIRDFREKGDTSKLIWHPFLTYSINRNLKDKNGKYKSKDPELAKFFDNTLAISKDTEESRKIEKILYPAVCTAIYKLRKK